MSPGTSRTPPLSYYIPVYVKPKSIPTMISSESSAIRYDCCGSVLLGSCILASKFWIFEM